jgi:uncharacterized iron-regulated membrane protein
MIQKIIEALGGRKSFMALLTVLLGTVVEFVKPGGLSESYVMLLVGIVGIFSGANALVSWKGMTVGEEAAKAPPEPGAGKVDEVDTKVNIIAQAVEQEVVSLKKEQATQAEALQKMTELLKGLLTIKQQ